ncbi:MAG: MEDS domain-containing protein [Methylobacter sp.]
MSFKNEQTSNLWSCKNDPMCQVNHQVSFDFAEQSSPTAMHICHLYTNENERRNTIAQFMRSGLLANEKVGYLADVMPPMNDMDSYLFQLGIIPSCQVKPKQLVLTQAEAAYCPDGTFLPERMLDYWRSFCNQAQSESFTGVRVTGDTSWISKGMPGIDRWIEYEATINSLMAEASIHGVMCQYDVSKLDGAMLFDVLSVHPMMIVAGQIVHNPYFSMPDKPAPSLQE